MSAPETVTYEDIILPSALHYGRSCRNCRHLGSDDDGGDPPGNSWAICDRFERYGYLKSFPFKKPMPCFELEFWASVYADRIGDNESENRKAFNDFYAVVATMEV